MWITEDIKSIGLSSGNFNSSFASIWDDTDRETRILKDSSWWTNKEDCISTPLERSSKNLGGKSYKLEGIGIDSDCSGCETDSSGREVEVEASSLRLREPIHTSLSRFDNGVKGWGSKWDLVCLGESRFNLLSQ